MASLLRQIVAGPRARHPEAGLDLCYVTDNIIATSGPSQTYPHRAWRNPLDHLVQFLDSKHGEDWAIWEFRAEGTGYPDDAVYGRIRHYPWPDHHPPPFRLMPMIMASMRNWLHGGGLNGPAAGTKTDEAADAKTGEKRVVVVHCKAGKGRSGTVSCSYLIAEEGWTPEEALARFTQRRMRPKFGAGVSIPSQLRWVNYMSRWTQGGKKYIDRPIEIMEIHVWGLRNGVKVDVEGFVDEGKKIEVLHTFNKEERIVIEGGVPSGGGFADVVYDIAGYGVKSNDEAEKAELNNAVDKTESHPGEEDASVVDEGKKDSAMKRKTEALGDKLHATDGIEKLKKKASSSSVKSSSSKTHADSNGNSSGMESPEDPEPGGMAVILKPTTPILVPSSDINVSVERRNRTHKSMGLTMVTAVAHVWFNAFFEGNGPESGGVPTDSGVFAIEWEAMDGIKGSSRKGTRALDKMAVVWRAAGTDGGDRAAVGGGLEVVEPKEGEEVPQVKAADWKGVREVEREKELGLRVQDEGSADVSKASSVKSVEGTIGKTAVIEDGEGDDLELHGVKSSGRDGRELDGEADEDEGKGKGVDVLENPDTASGTTEAPGIEVTKAS